MASLTFSNINPAKTAIQNKTNPYPLQPIKNTTSTAAYTPQKTQSTPLKSMDTGYNPAAMSSSPSWQQTLSGVNSSPVNKNAITLPKYEDFLSKNKGGGSIYGMSRPSDASFIAPKRDSVVTPTTPSSPSAQNSYSGGQAIPAVGTPEYAASQSLANKPAYTPPQVQNTPLASNNSTADKALSSTPYIESPFTDSLKTQSAYSKGAGNTAVNTSQSGLQGIAEGQTPQVVKAQEDYNKFAQQNPYMIAAQSNPNVAADIASGRSALLGQTFGDVLQAKQAAVTNALGGQGQQITAGTNAGNLAQGQQNEQITAAQNVGNLASPVAGATYFGNPVTGGLQGANTGTGGTTGNPLIDTSINNAMNIIARGGSTTDAINSLVGGDLAKQAFTTAMQRMDPNWTPTSSNAIAQQNMAQGQDAQGQANDLNLSLRQLDTVADLADDFLTKNNFLNSSNNKEINSAINTYIDTFAPQVKAQYEATMADISKFTSSILATNRGGIPTDVSEAMRTFDPHNLSAPALKEYLGYLKQLGDNQLSNLQENVKSNYGTSGPFVGSKTSTNVTAPTNNFSPDQMKVLNADKKTQIMLGGIAELAGGIKNFVKGAATAILK